MGTVTEAEVVKLIALVIGSGVCGTLFYLVRQIIKGELVPRSTLQDKINEASTWRATAEIRTEQTQKLIEQGQIAGSLLASINAEIRRIREGKAE